MAQLMFKIANEPPTDILSHQPELPPAWWRSSTRRMAKNADERYQTGEEFAAALRAAGQRRRAAAAAAPASTSTSSSRAQTHEPEPGPRNRQLHRPGMVRSHNEDSIAADAANGPGGARRRHGRLQRGRSRERHGDHGDHHRVAAAARRHAAVRDRPGDRQAVRRHACCASRSRRRTPRSIQAAQSQPQYAGMGTTLVVGAVLRQQDDGRAHRRLARCTGCAATSSSRSRATTRCCRSRSTAGMITQEQAKHSQNKNLVTRALGIDPTVEPEIHDYPTPDRATSTCCARTACATW